MSRYDVVMEVARGCEYRTGRQLVMQVMGQDRLDAALRAERVADKGLARTNMRTPAASRRSTGLRQRWRWQWQPKE